MRHTPPTARATRLAETWMPDSLKLETVATDETVNTSTLLPGETVSYTWTGTGRVRTVVESRDQGTESQDFGRTDYVVQVASDAVPVRGQRFTIVTCADDSTLDGRVGSVLTVERKTGATARRITVRMESQT